MYPNDWQYAQDRYNDKLRERERLHVFHPGQLKRPSLVSYLKSQLVAWANLVRPQHNRARRA